MTRLTKPTWADDHQDDETSVLWKTTSRQIETTSQHSTLEVYVHVLDSMQADAEGVTITRSDPLIFIGGEDLTVTQAEQLRDTLTMLLDQV